MRRATRKMLINNLLIKEANKLNKEYDTNLISFGSGFAPQKYSNARGYLSLLIDGEEVSKMGHWLSAVCMVSTTGKTVTLEFRIIINSVVASAERTTEMKLLRMGL